MTLLKDKVGPSGKYYLFATITLGTAVALYCLIATLRYSQNSTWLYFLVAIVLGALLPVRATPRARSKAWFTTTLNDLFIFLLLLLYSPVVAVVAAFVDGAISGALVLRPLYRILFNASRLAISTYVVGNIFYALAGSAPPLSPDADVISVFVNVGFSALIFYGLNTLLIEVAAWLSTDRRVFTDWQGDRLLAALPTIAGGLTSAAIFISLGHSEIYAVAVAVPTFLLAFAVYSINRERNKSIKQYADQLKELYHATIASLAMAIDAKDQSTHGHVYRVRALALSLARYLKVEDENELQALSAAALLHDIGKLAVPEYILNKPSPLTEGEMLKLKAHPAVGADILDTVPFSYPVVPFVRYHHEKWDGTGYPEALSGDKIPLGARILSVADAYDALRSDRPYRLKLSRDLALDYLRSERGKSFDSAVVDALLSNVEELEECIRAAEKFAPTGVIKEFETKLPAEPRNGQKVFDDIASTYREIQVVYQISEAVSQSLNTRETMNFLTDKIAELIHFDACAIFLANVNQNSVVLAHTTGMHSDLLEQVAIRIGEGVTGWVAANNQPLANVSPLPDFSSQTELQNAFKSCLSVPLSIEDRVLGVITLYSTSAAGFHQDHGRLMDTIAHHAAAAVNNALMFEETQEDAYTDLLTGLPNLRYFNAFMEQELGRAARIDYPVTLLMMDLECFKDVNDRYGHKVGDRTLVEIGQVLRRQMRRSDMLVRYAGDEFLAVLPGTTREQARQTIERIQAAVDNFKMPIRSEQFVRVGISVGAASYPEDGQDTDVLLSLADQDMYNNKIMRASHRAGSGDVLPFEKR